MNDMLLEFESVHGTGFGPCSCGLRAGGWLVVDAVSEEMGREWTDLAAGLRLPRRGTVRLFGADMSTLGESDRLLLLQDVGYAGAHGHLVANLKLWENLILPASYRGAPDLEAMEALILEAFAVAGLDESWAAIHLAKTPDSLTPFELRVSGLVRSAVSGVRLLLGEFLFDDMDETMGGRIAALVRWMMDRKPEMGVVMVRRYVPDVRFSLIPEGNGGIIELREVAE